MKFGPVRLAEAVGATAAHSISAGGGTIRKGEILSAEDITRLAAAGLSEVVVARLDPDDVTEDEAARRIAAAIVGSGVEADTAFTGRVNVHATTAGVLVVDTQAVDRLNAVDEAITLATLSHYAAIEAGRMVATVKIIPFAVAGSALHAAIAAAGGPLVSVAPYKLGRIGFVQTMTPGLLPKVLDKTARVTAARVDAMGAMLLPERRVAHDTAATARAVAEARADGAELILVFGASAIADRRDVVPEAIERAGGRIIHFGMPVDPGNLLLIGDIEGVPVVGAPGCARSPKENGFDWILARLVAGLPVTRADIMRMGVGGLLMEITTRPQPRGEKPVPAHPPKIGGIVLAAGRSTRMGDANKLLEDIDGKPVVRHSVDALLEAGLAPVVVVTGHMTGAVEHALAGLPVSFVHNQAFAEGLSTSLRAGIAAMPASIDAAVVALGDMPRVTPTLVRALADAYDPLADRLVALPIVDGKRGNPVLWARRFFPDLATIQGDVGARHLLGMYSDFVVEVPADDGALLDVDTPETLAEARRKK